jgi:hypothetical protein
MNQMRSGQASERLGASQRISSERSSETQSLHPSGRRFSNKDGPVVFTSFQSTRVSSLLSEVDLAYEPSSIPSVEKTCTD